MVQNCANHIARAIKRLDTGVLPSRERHTSGDPARTLAHSEMVLGRALRIQSEFHLVRPTERLETGLPESCALLECFDVQRMWQIGAIFQLIARHLCAVKPTFALPDLHYF